MIITTIPVNCLKLSERSLWLDSMDTVMHEIVTAFLCLQLIKQINYDCLVSYTIWFAIDCIYETVMLRFDPILWQLEKQSILTLSRLYSVRFGLI